MKPENKRVLDVCTFFRKASPQREGRRHSRSNSQNVTGTPCQVTPRVQCLVVCRDRTPLVPRGRRPVTLTQATGPSHDPSPMLHGILHTTRPRCRLLMTSNVTHLTFRHCVEVAQGSPSRLLASLFRVLLFGRFPPATYEALYSRYLSSTLPDMV